MESATTDTPTSYFEHVLNEDTTTSSHQDGLLEQPSSIVPVYHPATDTRHHHIGQDDKPPCVCRWEDCRMQFQTLQHLVEHIEHVHTASLQNYVCHWQGCTRDKKPFDARYKLITHLRCHTGERPYNCTYGGCTRKFSRLENLKLHVRTHTGEKPYVCHHTDCGKKFNNTSDRAKHMKTHITRKPYVCRHPGCSKAYTDPSSMRKHIKFAHKTRLVNNQLHGPTGNTAIGSKPTTDRIDMVAMATQLQTTSSKSTTGVTSPLIAARSLVSPATPTGTFPPSVSKQPVYMMMPVTTATIDTPTFLTATTTPPTAVYNNTASNNTLLHQTPTLITLPAGSVSGSGDIATHPQYMLLQQPPTATQLFAPQLFNSQSGQIVSFVPQGGAAAAPTQVTPPSQYLQPLYKTTTVLPKFTEQQQQTSLEKGGTGPIVTLSTHPQLTQPYATQLVLSPGTAAPSQPVLVPVLSLSQQPLTESSKH